MLIGRVTGPRSGTAGSTRKRQMGLSPELGGRHLFDLGPSLAFAVESGRGQMHEIRQQNSIGLSHRNVHHGFRRVFVVAVQDHIASRELGAGV